MQEPPDLQLPFLMSLLRKFIRISRLIKIKILYFPRVKNGNNVIFGKSFYKTPLANLDIGSDVSFGSNFHLETSLEVGDGVLFSSYVSIVADDHSFDDPTKNIFWSGRKPRSVTVIEGDNLIGFGTIIIGPVKIGKGCVIGAGSIVTKDLPANSVCVGSPAKKIKNRF
jgi:acetyltransferase-like isoleucine patch superfamily enzyme